MTLLVFNVLALGVLLGAFVIVTLHGFFTLKKLEDENNKLRNHILKMQHDK